MKTKIYDSFVIGILVGAVAFCIITVIVNYFYATKTEKKPKSWTDVRGNVDIEYLMEVSEDSIWIENYDTGRVYGGKYSDLEFLVNKDNL